MWKHHAETYIQDRSVSIPEQPQLIPSNGKCRRRIRKQTLYAVTTAEDKTDGVVLDCSAEKTIGHMGWCGFTKYKLEISAVVHVEPTCGLRGEP